MCTGSEWRELTLRVDRLCWLLIGVLWVDTNGTPGEPQRTLQTRGDCCHGDVSCCQWEQVESERRDLIVSVWPLEDGVSVCSLRLFK